MHVQEVLFTEVCFRMKTVLVYTGVSEMISIYTTQPKTLVT